MASIANCLFTRGSYFVDLIGFQSSQGGFTCYRRTCSNGLGWKKTASPQKPWEGIRGYRFERPADSVSPLGSWEWFDMIQTYPNTSSVKYQKRGVPTNLYLSLSGTNCTHPATLPSNPNHTLYHLYQLKKNKNSLPINYSYFQHSSHLPTPMFHFLQLFFPTFSSHFGITSRSVSSFDWSRALPPRVPRGRRSSPCPARWARPAQCRPWAPRGVAAAAAGDRRGRGPWWRRSDSRRAPPACPGFLWRYLCRSMYMCMYACMHGMVWYGKECYVMSCTMYAAIHIYITKKTPRIYI